MPVARIELLDALSLSHQPVQQTTLAEAPTLFFEFHGSPAGVEEQAQTVQAIADDLGGTDFRMGNPTGRPHAACGGPP